MATPTLDELQIIVALPRLAGTAFGITSPKESRYNCIAWAAGDTRRWWWPRSGYWPKDVARQESLEAFVAAFVTLGYAQCDDAHLEPAFDKVALYTVGGKPRHAARQLPDGAWTSKLGRDHDVTHELRAIEGDVYGTATAFLRRPASPLTEGKAAG